MKLEEAITNLRDMVDERTSTVNTTGTGFPSGSLGRYIARGEKRGYRQQLIWGNDDFLVSNEPLAGADTDLIALPTDFNKGEMYALWNDTAKSTQYQEIPFFMEGCTYDGSYLFYFRDSQIGVIPQVPTGSYVYLDYYKDYTPMSETEDSNLHEYIIEGVIFYAAVQALKFRGDPNWKEVQDELDRWEVEMYPKIRKSSRVPTKILPYRYPYAIKVINRG